MALISPPRHSTRAASSLSFSAMFSFICFFIDYLQASARLSTFCTYTTPQSRDPCPSPTYTASLSLSPVSTTHSSVCTRVSLSLYFPFIIRVSSHLASLTCYHHVVALHLRQAPLERSASIGTSECSAHTPCSRRRRARVACSQPTRCVRSVLLELEASRAQTEAFHRAQGHTATQRHFSRSPSADSRRMRSSSLTGARSSWRPDQRSRSKASRQRKGATCSGTSKSSVKAAIRQSTTLRQSHVRRSEGALRLPDAPHVPGAHFCSYADGDQPCSMAFAFARRRHIYSTAANASVCPC